MNFTLKQTLFSNWHPMRWIALGTGLFFTVQTLLNWDAFSGFLGAFFLFQAITNSGCMMSASCTVPPASNNDWGKTDTENIEYTELKND